MKTMRVLFGGQNHIVKLNVKPNASERFQGSRGPRGRGTDLRSAVSD